MARSMRKRLFSLLAAIAGIVGASAAGVVPATAAEPGFVGMEVQTLSPEAALALGLKDTKGVLVRDIAPGGPAALAGVRRGDLIVKVSGKAVDSVEQLAGVLKATPPNRELPLGMLRQGKPANLTLKTGDWPPGWKVETGASAAIPELGLTLAAVTPKVRQNLGLRWGSIGVVVTIVDDAKAKDMSLKRGEVIHQADQRDVWLPEQIMAQLKEAKTQGRQAILLLVEGVNGFRYVFLPVPP
jgi:serine protease Do